MAETGAATRLKRVLALLLCMSFTCFWAFAMRNATPGPMKDADFDVALYYFARCAMEKEDPYNYYGKCVQGEILPSGLNDKYAEVFLPTTLLFVVPLAKQPLPAAETAWLFLNAGLLVLAAFLVWELGSDAPNLAGWMTCFMLLNCEVILVVGDVGGMAVELCVIAVCCLFMPRYWLAGVLLLAMSLVLKPHDTGLVWLYLLLAGGVPRKRALQALAAVGALVACGAVWIAPIAPRWVEEMGGNILGFSHGQVAVFDPLVLSNYSPNLSLRAAISIFSRNPYFYNSVSYAIGGGLILAWMVAVLRKRTKSEGSPQALREGTLLALAAISMLTLIAVYHRAYDAKLLLLAIPACAMLWAHGGARRWLALGLTSAAILVTSDIPRMLLVKPMGNLHISASTLSGKLRVLALNPAPLVLLAAGCFYLWVYWRYEPAEAGVRVQEEAVAKA